VHLDLRCATDEFDGEVARLAAQGAELLQPPRSEAYGRIANLADPDGNPFDLCAYN
jgi:predicted enzyme related to lactoylglutathione lyase